MSRFRLRRTTTRIVVAMATMLFLLLPATVAAGQPTGTSYNARTEFQVSPNQANPSGPWSYRRVLPDGSKPLLHLFATGVTNTCGSSGEGQNVWFGPEALDLPAVWKNTTGGDAFPCGAFVPKGALMVHPMDDDNDATKQAVVIRWTSPAAGSIHIDAVIIDRDGFCGEGVNYAIQIGRQPYIAKATLQNGGSAEVSSGWYHVEEGSKLELRVGSGTDHSGCDSTQVNLKVRLMP